MKNPSHIVANSEDLYFDEPILDECLDIDSFLWKII
jgi:hypothetical protein